MHKNDNIVDCTLGTGGHTREILKHTTPQGCVLGIDLDKQSLREAKRNLKQFGRRVIFVQDNFKNLKDIVKRYNFRKIKGVLIDLGVSSLQLEERGRGFSFLRNGFLDMRMDQNQPRTAARVINHYSYWNLLRIFQDYGDLPRKQAVKLVKAILEERRKKKIQTTFELKRLIIRALPSFQVARMKRAQFQKEGISKTKIHPATRVFQALRIEVNTELDNLREVLPQTLEVLEPGGRVVVISFHSGEDREVKNFFRQCAKECICPDEAWFCTCQHRPEVKILTKKPLRPSEDELKDNPRARSARLRAVEKI